MAALLNHKVLVVQPPFWRPLQGILARDIHLLVVKWFVPDDVEMAGGGVLVSMERTKDPIAISSCILRSFV
jgi:hypothetical protein